MNIVEPTTALKIAFGAVIITAIIYCVWKGRKVKHIKWEDDDNNPANWYLKDPKKFK